MFYLKKFDIIFMDLKIPTFKKNFILTMLYSLTWPDWTQKKIFLNGRGFRGGLDEKMRRTWLGLGIVVVGLPPFL